MGQTQITIAVGLIKNDIGEILIGRRNQPDLRDEHNKWEFPGGGIGMREDPEVALIREVKEETGLDVKIIRLLPKVLTHVWKREAGNDQIIILTYECEIIGGEIKLTEPEIAELKFVAVQDVKNYDCLPNVEKIIDLLANH